MSSFDYFESTLNLDFRSNAFIKPIDIPPNVLKIRASGRLCLISFGERPNFSRRAVIIELRSPLCLPVLQRDKF